MIVDAHVHVARRMTGFRQPLRYGKVRETDGRQLLDWVRRHCPFLSEPQRAEILGGAAMRVLRAVEG